MSSLAVIPLRDRLFAAAQAWSRATGRSLGALSSTAGTDGKLFDRLADPTKTVTDATLEKFARFLVDPVNWPANEAGIREVGDEAKALAHAVGVSLPEVRDHAA